MGLLRRWSGAPRRSRTGPPDGRSTFNGHIVRPGGGALLLSPRHRFPRPALVVWSAWRSGRSGGARVAGFRRWQREHGWALSAEHALFGHLLLRGAEGG